MSFYSSEGNHPIQDDRRQPRIISGTITQELHRRENLKGENISKTLLNLVGRVGIEPTTY